MFLLEPTETPYDLHFSIFGIHVRVHPMFWLITAILGWSGIEMGSQFVIAWIVVVFVSVLIHEIGHVVMGRIFGSDGRIVLYSFGGLAVGSNHLASRGQRILVCLAGPLAGFLFLAVVLVAAWLRDPASTRGEIMLTAFGFGLVLPGLHDPNDIERLLMFEQQNPLAADILRQLVFINLTWGVVNLLPIWPLDGGQISRDALEGASPRHGMQWAMILSIAIAAFLAAHFLLADYGHPIIPFLGGSKYAALMFGLLAFQSFQMLQQIRAQRRWHDEHWN